MIRRKKKQPPKLFCVIKSPLSQIEGKKCLDTLSSTSKSVLDILLPASDTFHAPFETLCSIKRTPRLRSSFYGRHTAEFFKFFNS